MSGDRLGVVDGSLPANTRRFHVVLDDAAMPQLDDLLVSRQTLPDGRVLAHYGIVVESTGIIEGAEMPSDTQRIAERTMPGLIARRVEVQVLRTAPELWIAPAPGAEVLRARGADRDKALFLDQMDEKLPVGLDQADEPVYADFSFLNGEKGGHVSISGISGVATKTSYALFLLYMLFETEAGRALLGRGAAETRALVFSVKGEDLLHIDRDNLRLQADGGRDNLRPQAGGGRDADTDADDSQRERREEALARWRKLGVDEPGRFRSVALYAPRAPGARFGVVADVSSRDHDELTVFGWPPIDFLREGLLRFCFADDEDQRSQVSFVEQRVRVQLARWAYPVQGQPGAAVLCEPPPGTSFVLERVQDEHRTPRPAGDGVRIDDFGDLVDFLARKVSADAPDYDPAWVAGAAPGTVAAFLRRLYAQQPRLGALISVGVRKVELSRHVSVVDIHGLHDSAQRFVVGALLSQIFADKQGAGREPLRFIVLDELNKYAPRHGQSPIKDVLVDIAARGRSLGVLLIGAQQAASDVDANIVRNAALKVVGRLDAGEAAEYRFLSAELRERAARFLPGTLVLDQPLIPAPIPLRFPFPGFATNPGEAVGRGGDRDAGEDGEDEGAGAGEEDDPFEGLE
ncbi:ATP-binding protein [Haliangium ochraceum]|uniref:ATPase-like protein n=1 Tax=Haliangium ochraceum (strain DSM 14365 / JCM 11303 / SMP-2) TaxID=502025 RepID=D0LLB2_HALO1|nr:ATP-binding protein [Haliangium ochraceum]ACY18608.1 ATPase-like protein [Haliangium ochraceum DSM 14365]